MKNQFLKLCKMLFDDTSDKQAIREAIDRISKIYNEILTPEYIKKLKMTGEKETYKGIALDPISAISCFKDYIRTYKYLKGTYKAIIDLQKQFPDESIKILYGGCGPLAALVLPLFSQFSSEEIQVSLIDINKTSLNSVKLITENLGVCDYIAEYIEADAATYKFINNIRFHLAVTETMTAAFFKEGQVSVTYNLVSHLLEGGILIPEEVKIDAVITRPEKEFTLVRERRNDFRVDELDQFRTYLGTLLRFNKEKIIKDKCVLPKYIDCGIIKHPEKYESDEHFFLCTVIKVYRDVIINEYESGLTAPILFHPGIIGEYGNLHFIYDICETPQFRIKKT